MAEMTEQIRTDFLREVRVGVLSMERVDDAPMSAPVWYWLTDDAFFSWRPGISARKAAGATPTSFLAMKKPS